MKTTMIATVMISLMAMVPSYGQEAESPAGTIPAVTNVPDGEYPRIDENLRGIFRVCAPDAQSVQLSLGGRYDMVKGEDGVWSVMTDPLVPGFHYYSLIIDGFAVADPASQSFFGSGHMSSGIEVPEAGVDFYCPKDVPHGELRARFYYSVIEGKTRRCFVYTPPGYDQNTTTRYPVLYLQHGMGEDERGWFIQGKVNFIMDSMIAEGRCKSMIVVIDNGNIAAGFSGGPPLRLPLRQDGPGGKPEYARDLRGRPGCGLELISTPSSWMKSSR